MKTCPKCAERVQDAALICRFCGYEFTVEADDRDQSNGVFPPGVLPRLLVIIGGVLLLFVTTSHFSGPENPNPASVNLDRTASPVVGADAVAQCAAYLTRGRRLGLIRARPSNVRIDVEDRLWEELPAETKRITLQAVSCQTFRTSMPAGSAGIVAYGYRSGRRLAMLTAAGVTYE